MPVTTEDAMKAAMHAMLEVAANGAAGDDGMLNKFDQKTIRSIAELAQDPESLAEVLSGEDGEENNEERPVEGEDEDDDFDTDDDDEGDE